MKKQILALSASLLMALPWGMAQGTLSVPQEGDTTAVRIVSDTIAVDAAGLAETEDNLEIECVATDDGVLENPIYLDGSDHLMVRLAGGDVMPLEELLVDNWGFDGGPSWAVVALLAVVIGIPAIAMIIALVLLFNFLRKRNYERNEIIAKAIDHNYELPEAFYTKQPSYEAGAAPTSPGEEGKVAYEGTSSPIPPSYRRNPRVFSLAITLIGIGLSVAIFFCVVEAPGAGVLLGGIPFFIGLGKLIGYYKIPGFDMPDNTYRGPQRPPYNPPYPPYQGARPSQQPFNQGGVPPRAANHPGDNQGCPPPPPGYNG